MNEALDVFWQTVRDWWNSAVGLVSLNVLWLVVSLTVVLLPPATAGVYGVTHSIAQGTGQRTSDFVETARRYFGLSWVWALANLLVTAIIYADVAFYATSGGGFGLVMQWLLIVLGLFWTAMQVYFWPFLLVQERKNPFLAWKNAAYLSLGAPVYTLIIAFAAGAIVVISGLLIIPLALFSLSFVSLLGNRAVLERLTAYGKLSGLAQSPGDDSP
ncbi:MAG: hypothetical protein GYB65_15275 [Chloroflexi bacterium]|nr:hypothetical protein [Chloroflexota bacterium]